MDLALFGGPQTVTENGPHYVWPRITDAVKDAVMEQLHTGEISIYDNSGVFDRFEKTFVDYHDGLQPFGLVQNSGTSALWSMYVGADLKHGDEVIVPTYSFYATYTPLMWTGAKLVFCDAGTDGNIDPHEIQKLITSRTKAVVVTHMWGIPCDMPAITQICKKHNLLLFEDCSHAHGATIAGQKVGTFGDAAAWSLQGQKIVTGGEGGIMLTRNENIFSRAILLGQYNKRAQRQVSREHELYEFYLTGMGMKLRAHPLAIAMAMEQFSHLDEWLTQKRQFARIFSQALGEFSFIKAPEFMGEPAWYAYVFQYDGHESGVSIDQFEKALRAEGLSETDRPNSTRPNHDLPLFQHPHKILPHLYGEEGEASSLRYPGAERFYAQAIKLPVWAFPDEEEMVQKYASGLVKVAQAIKSSPDRFLVGHNE